jgi:hypothetical protein
VCEKLPETPTNTVAESSVLPLKGYVVMVDFVTAALYVKLHVPVQIVFT